MFRRRFNNVTEKAVRLTACILLLTSLTLTLGQQIHAERPLSEFGDVKDPKKAFALLENLATESVSLDGNLGRNRVSIENGMIAYDFRPAANANLGSRPDRLTAPLEYLIRIEALNRDFRATLPTEKFWIGPLERIRGLAEAMVEAAYGSTSEDEWSSKKQAYEEEVGKEFAGLADELIAYGKKSRLDLTGTRGTVEGYRVEIHVDPPKARVRYMPFLSYKKCMLFKLNLNDYWLDLGAGTRSLIGRYHYIAEWPPSLNGPEEGNFEVNAEGMTLTFQPKEN
jgi:hypothetical protein